MTCPRCHQEHEGEFYGPCESCRAELRQLRPPAPDDRYKSVTKMDGSHHVDPPFGGDTCGHAGCGSGLCVLVAT